MEKIWQYTYPIGPLFITEENSAITGVFFSEHAPKRNIAQEQTPLIEKTAQQLEEYFAGTRRIFDLPLHFNGTEFQKSVWRALMEIPYGETRTYGEIAKQVGNPKASRAVGMANNRNPISIIAPCHRVIGANGSLTGYGGGTNAKAWLLEMESSAPQTTL